MQKSLSSQEYALFLTFLREARQNAGLSQLELAKRLGATQSFVSKCERGERRLDIVELRIWCIALNHTLPSFITELEKFFKANRKRQ